MKYMLDTNICIYLMNERLKHVSDKFKTLLNSDAAISSVALSELNYGACKSHYQEKNLVALDKFIISVPVLPYDIRAASHFGEIRATLEKKGVIIGAYDLMIAAHALSLNAILVTNNTKEFSRVKNLKLENWAK